MKRKFEGFNMWLDAKGYPTIWLASKSIKVHVFVWERENGRKPKGMQLHHKDFDKANYSIENLELLTQSNHFKIHAGWIRNNKGEWILKPCKDCKQKLPLDQFYQRKGLTPSHYCRDCAKIRWEKEAKEKGITPRRFIIPNINDEFYCIECKLYNKRNDHKFNGLKPQSYCKKCFNRKQKQWRKIRLYGS